MKNLITYFHFSSDVQYSSLQCRSHKNRNLLDDMLQYPQKCEFQLRCIEFNVPRTNSSIKQLRGENREHYGTGPDQLYPRAFALRPNRALLVLAIFKMVIDEKMLALRLLTSAT